MMALLTLILRTALLLSLCLGALWLTASLLGHFIFLQ